MTAPKTLKKCSECGAYTGHTPNCSKMSNKYARQELIRYWKEWQKLNLKLSKIKKILERGYNA